MFLHRATTFLALTVCISCTCSAGGNWHPTGARSAATGNASLMFTDLWSVYNNQAGLASLEAFSLGAAYENRYFLGGLGNKSFALAVPTGSGTIGVSASSFGYSKYSDNRFGLAYARKLSEKLDVGLQLDYQETRIAEGYGRRGSLTAELGIIARPFKKLALAAHVYNPMRTRMAQYNDERVPTILRTGAQYAFTNQVRLCAQIDKDLDEPLNLRTGIEYEPVNNLQIRIGYATYLQEIAFGFGYGWYGLQLDVAASWQQVTGYSTQLSLAYAFMKKQRPQ